MKIFLASFILFSFQLWRNRYLPKQSKTARSIKKGISDKAALDQINSKRKNSRKKQGFTGPEWKKALGFHYDQEANI